MDIPYLEIQAGGQRLEFPLEQARITIGRHEANTLVVHDVRASRSHCVIERIGESFQVRDLKSSNGTKVNGQLIETVGLEPGDVIAIGATTLTLIFPEPTLNATDILTDEDVVDEAGPSDLLLVENEFSGHEGGTIQVDVNDDYEKGLHSLAQSLPNHLFNEGDISFVNSRGVVVHESRTKPAPRKGGRRESVDLLRLILLVSFRSRTTDIHMESREGFYQLRLRIDGSMVDICRIHQIEGGRVFTLIKVMCEIDIAHRNVIQEGHFSARMPSTNGSTRRVDFRISFAPSVFGQKCVIRVLDTSNAPLRAADLNLPSWMLSEIAVAIKQDAGMVMVSGPTGSGKTTSLYALVRSIELTRRNVVTIEDPVEIQLDGVTQIPVDEAAGKSFPQLLRSVLRQDPDVILVGEIRDADTARVAMQAAITGHLVFSTIHTKDTIGTIFRLLDLGVEPYLVAQGLHTVLAQRLVRQLCQNCKRPVAITDDQKKTMGEIAANIDKLYIPVGCPRCLGTGYAGRRGIFELLRVNDELRDVIQKAPGNAEIQAVLADQKFRRLSDNGYQLAVEGVAAFVEVDRAVGRDRG